MSKTVEFELDGRPIQARSGETILQAARRSGAEIPSLCYQDGLRPDGNCRACVVEVDGERVLAAACCRAPTPAMKVSAHSPRARAAQAMVVEMLAAEAGFAAGPGSTTAAAAGAVVDAGEPGSITALDADHRAGSELARLVDSMDIALTRFARREPAEPDDSHPAIAVRLDACIQCTRCLRACREAQGNDVIGFAGRGEHTRIVFDFGDELGSSTCVACGECVQACPTGALMPRLLGTAALAGAPAGLPGGAVPVPAPAAAPIAPRAAERQVDSLCPYCGVGCQMTYHVSGNRIVHVAGRDGPANLARLCVKGRFGFDYAMSPQRLTVPLVRRAGAKKNPNFARVPENWRDDFREASWEEALALAGGTLARIRDSAGAGALAGFGSAKGSNEEAYLFQKLVRVGFGNNNVDHCTRLCHASSVAALMEGLGSGSVSNPVRDVLAAEVVMVIGANPSGNHPVAASWIRNAVRSGTKLIVANPRRGQLARYATHNLQFRPDTDVALLNAMLHTIIAEDLVDHDFVARRTSGFEELRANVAEFTPEAMAPVCGIDADTIRTVARCYARSRASMILWGMGVSQHIHGTDNARCLIALSLITGQIGRPGTGLHPLRGQNNVQGASDAGLIPMVFPGYQSVSDPAAAARFESFWGVPLAREPGLTVVEIINAARAGTVRGMYVMGENPAMSDPDLTHAREGLARLEMLVVQDIFPTETAYLADVILPASALAEKGGTFTNTDRMVQLARPVLTLPGQARQDLSIITAMARALGLDWPDREPREVFAEMAACTDAIAGIRWARLEREGSVTYPCVKEGDPGEPVVFQESFPTADGRARIVPAKLIQAAELPDEHYPMVLVTGRQLEHWHTGAMTRRSQALDALEPVATAALHPADLQRLGVAPGALISVRSRRGEIRLAARQDDGVFPGSVFIAFAYAEAAANRLTNPVLDPFGKIPEFKFCAVAVAAAQG